MEQMTFEYPANQSVNGRAHVGVTGSGDLEILMEPSVDGMARVEVKTQSEGFKDAWQAVLDRFFVRHDLAVAIEINDFGATPGVVSLRLAQAVEALKP
ncbi:malonate decarboxylase subunit delta [Alicyclobacillus tolerans]|uniref:malonate decarboxylase subunit delta n=1 Tax=Alicyclobacillus tolerans TaxID=90970 RepID=UPI001F3B6631|nr:malonate decarboxylase subunit delta [Alicyclobacillus tolerans]MCF8563209.1 malonate decarboxylase subunit delta [Alicyclobacillus tolerans]